MTSLYQGSPPAVSGRGCLLAAVLCPESVVSAVSPGGLVLVLWNLPSPTYSYCEKGRYFCLYSDLYSLKQNRSCNLTYVFSHLDYEEFRDYIFIISFEAANLSLIRWQSFVIWNISGKFLTTKLDFKQNWNGTILFLEANPKNLFFQYFLHPLWIKTEYLFTQQNVSGVWCKNLNGNNWNRCIWLCSQEDRSW